MKKIYFMGVLRSLLSIFLVTTLTYTIIYTMVPRKLIQAGYQLQQELQRLQISRDNYENTVYERYGLYRVLRYQGVARKKLAQWTHL